MIPLVYPTFDAVSSHNETQTSRSPANNKRRRPNSDAQRHKLRCQRSICTQGEEITRHLDGHVLEEIRVHRPVQSEIEGIEENQEHVTSH